VVGEQRRGQHPTAARGGIHFQRPGEVGESAVGAEFDQPHRAGVVGDEEAVAADAPAVDRGHASARREVLQRLVLGAAEQVFPVAVGLAIEQSVGVVLRPGVGVGVEDVQFLDAVAIDIPSGEPDGAAVGVREGAGDGVAELAAGPAEEAVGAAVPGDDELAAAIAVQVRDRDPVVQRRRVVGDQVRDVGEHK